MVYRTGGQAAVFTDWRKRREITLTVTALCHRQCYGVDERGHYWVFGPQDRIAVPSAIAMDHRTYVRPARRVQA